MLDQFLLGLSVSRSLGRSVIMQPHVLMYAYSGVFLGKLIAVLPDVGAITAISLLLPVTFYLDATTSMILLAGIYYGSQYGGAIASILVLAAIPMIVIMICVGVYSHRTSVTDVLLTLAFGVLWYLMKNDRFEPAPVLLGFMLGPLLEENFCREMLL